MNFLKYIFDENNKKVVLGAIFVAVLLLRLGFLFSIQSELRWYDEKNYHSIAVSIADGKGFESTYNPYSTTRWAPLQAYIIAGVYKVFGQSPAIVRIVQDILSVLICYLIFWLGAVSFGYAVGLIACLIFAFHPVFIYTANLLYPAVNFTLLSLFLFVSLLLGLRSKRYKYFLLAGVFLGLAMLCKPVAIFFIPAIPVALFFNKKFSFVQLILNTIFVVFVSLVALIPWTVHNYLKYDKIYFITTEGAHSLGATNNPDFSLEKRRDNSHLNEAEKKAQNLSVEEKDKLYMQEAQNFILAHPVQFIKLYLKKFANFWRLYPETKTKNIDTSKTNRIISNFFYGMLFALSVIGLLLSLKSWRNLVLYYGFILFFALGYSLFLTSIRYRLPIEPYLMVLAGVGLVYFFKKWLPKGVFE